MGKFDYTIQILRDEIDSLQEFDERTDLIPDIDVAIRALEQYERYEKLIEAAGKIKDPQTTAGILQAILLSKVDNQQGKYAKALHEAIALLSDLPDDEKRVEDRKEPQ
jgi:hypothetical protein